MHWLSCGRKVEPEAWCNMFCILSEAELVMLNNLEVRRPHPAPPTPPAPPAGTNGKLTFPGPPTAAGGEGGDLHRLAAKIHPPCDFGSAPPRPQR